MTRETGIQAQVERRESRCTGRIGSRNVGGKSADGRILSGNKSRWAERRNGGKIEAGIKVKEGRRAPRRGTGA